MAWSTPVAPVSGTVITVAWAVANIVTPINWLRTMTGGTDPPGTGYMVTADSTTATTWKTGVAAILAVLGYTPANPAGFTMTGNLTFGAVAGLIFRGNAGATPSGMRDFAAQGLVVNAHGDSFEVYDQLLAFTAIFQAIRVAGVPTGRIGGATIWHDSNTALRVATAAIQALAVTTAKLADDAVTTLKILDANVTLQKMAANSVNETKLVASTVVNHLGYTPSRRVSGTFTGNGAAGRTITVSGSFTPTLVILHKTDTGSRWVIDASAGAVPSLIFNAVSGNVETSTTTKLTSGGFIVDDSVDSSNTNAVAYAYEAFG